jgi:hypothetical protein
MATDNSDLAGKLLVRRAALEALGGERARVLDCFAGEGHMFEKAWNVAEAYLGIERRFARPAGDPRGECWRGDNRMLVDRAFAREPWNIVDLDAYGSPWQLLRRVARAATGSRLVVTLTCGLSRSMCGSTSLPRWARQLTGATGLSYTGMMVRWYDDVVRWTIAYCVRDSGLVVARARRARSRSNVNVWYWLVELSRQ